MPESSRVRKVLIVSPGNERVEVGLERFYERAFRQLGLTVQLIGLARADRYSAIRDRVRRRVEQALAQGLAPDLVCPEVLERARRFSPDATFVIRAERLQAEMVRALAKLSPAGCFNIFTDHPFVIPGKGAVHLQEALQEYSSLFTFSRALIPVFLQLGAPRVHWLPFGFDAQIHKPVPAAGPSGIAYFGVWGPLQERWLTSVKEFELKIYGGGWGRLPPASPLRACVQDGLGIGDGMAAAIASSALSFNLIRAEHGCAHSMKTFELPACGAVVVVNRTDEQQLFFQEGIECVYFDTAVELVDKVRFHLANPAARNAIRENALKAVQPHSYVERAKDLLTYIESGMLPIEQRFASA